MTADQLKKLTSGMFKDKSYYMPDIDWDEDQEFDSNGMPIPMVDKKVVTEAIPSSMPIPMLEASSYTEEEKLKAEEIAAAGNDWKAELKRMMLSMNKPKKEEGMLSTKEESNPKEDQIAKGYHQMPDGSVMKDEDHKEEVSTDVAKDLDNEGRGLKGYKPPGEPEKRGYKQDDGGNYSVDTKDDYWQTKEGYKAAVDLYGSKPAWVKEPSLIYNPKTGKYDKIEQDEYVEIKPKRISL
tara:strand:- start:717 stop:1430 length:714 start_codon:yes stop_codon:yes gene_type:complete